VDLPVGAAIIVASSLLCRDIARREARHDPAKVERRPARSRRPTDEPAEQGTADYGLIIRSRQCRPRRTR